MTIQLLDTSRDGTGCSSDKICSSGSVYIGRRGLLQLGVFELACAALQYAERCALMGWFPVVARGSRFATFFGGRVRRCEVLP